MSGDPTRMSDGDGPVSEWMRDLLRAEARSDADVLDRVRGELEPLLETPPGAPAGPGLPLAKLAGLGLLAVAVGGLLWSWSGDVEPAPVAPSEGSVQPPHAPPAAPAHAEAAPARPAVEEAPAHIETPSSPATIPHARIDSVAAARQTPAFHRPPGRGSSPSDPDALAAEPAESVVESVESAGEAADESADGEAAAGEAAAEEAGIDSATAEEASSLAPRPDSFEEELALVSRAQRTIEADPRGALRLLEEHLRRFPAGQLREEREAYMIDVLTRVGRVEEARGRARTFERRWPHSTYRGRIQECLRRVEPGSLLDPPR